MKKAKSQTENLRGRNDISGLLLYSNIAEQFRLLREHCA